MTKKQIQSIAADMAGDDPEARALVAAKFPLREHPCSWPEDFAHENGNYENSCIFCEAKFIGHKRRVICKVCATTRKP